MQNFKKKTGLTDPIFHAMRADMTAKLASFNRVRVLLKEKATFDMTVKKNRHKELRLVKVEIFVFKRVSPLSPSSSFLNIVAMSEAAATRTGHTAQQKAYSTLFFILMCACGICA